MTMKKFLKAYFHREILLPDYLYAVFTNRAVVISFCIAFGAAFGIAVFKMVGVFAFLAWGPTTVPYTTSPIGYLAWVFLGGIAGFIVTEIRAMRRFFAPKKAEPTTTTESINLDPLAFNAETGILSYRGKVCEIPFKTYQHALCAKLFERPGARVPEKDIIRMIDWEMDKSDSYRLVKDAVYAVNAKARTAFGIEKMLMWEKLTAWVSDEYLA